MTPADTICAVATAAGAGGVGIVRLSGPRAFEIARSLSHIALQPRRAKLARFRDRHGDTIDRGLVLAFAAPHSFTGEDVVELHAHGSRVVLAQLVAQCCVLGARPARAGEFSERAFANGKLDLVQAEAIADLIAASSQSQARAAMRSLEGAFSQRVSALASALEHLRVYVEAAIDFPEEEIDFLAEPRVLAELRDVRANVDETLAAARRGQRVRDGLHVVIVGRPNAGKSSLLNALAGTERAIVTDIPGTTRDLLRETVAFDGVELTLVDTAGLRESEDPVEREGVRRARAELERADLALIVVDASATGPSETTLRGGTAEPVATARALLAEQADRATLLVFTQIDRADAATLADLAQGFPAALAVSAKTGAGLDALRQTLATRAAGEAHEDTFSARARHVEALRRVAEHLADGEHQLVTARAGELLAEDLRRAQHALSEITGEYTSDDLLGAIFSSFCIGK